MWIGDFQGFLATRFPPDKCYPGFGNAEGFGDIFEQVFIGLAIDWRRANLHFQSLSIKANEHIATGFRLYMAVQH